jgi:hypothetical protein
MLHDVISNPTREEKKQQTKEIKKLRKMVSGIIFNKEARVWMD